MYALPAVLAAMTLSACGTEGVDLPGEKDPAIKEGAQLFDQRCSGCHTLNAAGAQGSAFRVNDREYKDGPNFNSREISYDQVLYAVRNGGFSSGPMPQNIVVGKEAEDVAKFLSKYAGGEVGRATDADKPAPAGVSGSPVDRPEKGPQGEETPDPRQTPKESKDRLENQQPPG